jgi:secreted trypsin-like serine protease
MRKKTLALAIAAASIVTVTGPAAAITDGELDGDDHPQVVLILAEVDGAAAFRCSGTMISPTYVLTAGHCVTNFPDEGEVTAMRIFTESAVDGGDNSYPNAGNNSIEAARWATHPDYESAPFFVNDVGMIELAEPYVLDDDKYASLPEVDSLDAYATKRGKQKLTFTAVGYGLQRINPVFVEGARVRHVAYPKLNAINAPGFTGDFSLLLSNNHSTGGTCFGDSGGPNFIADTNIVGGVTSFGLNGSCGGTGGVFRMDRQNVQDFVADFIGD